jgi:NAD(P)-dependent dehydrogenase (short-subunit alcohol dehydrogenase family)
VLGVNLTGAFHVTRAVLGGMIERRAGRIVNIASGTAVRVSAGAAAYASSKAGLIAFTKAVAAEGAPFGVTANAVSPGLVDTAMTRRLMPTDDALQAAATSSPIANPMGVVLTPEDIAHAVVFLCHPASGRITGQVLHVNAGALMP